MRTIRFSPYLLAVALTPVFLQTSTPVSCKSGDTTLSELALIVESEDQIVGFDQGQRSYSVSLPVGIEQARVTAASTDAEATLWVDILVDGERTRYFGHPTHDFGSNIGVADLIVPLQRGPNILQVWVRAPGGASDYYEVAIQAGLPCTEDALREAVAAGGGPHVFDCDEPIFTTSTIDIGRGVQLDGLGTLVVSGAQHDRPVFWVYSSTVEFRGMTIRDGDTPWQGGAITIDGHSEFPAHVTIVDSTLSDNNRGAISATLATLTVVNSVITRNTNDVTQLQMVTMIMVRLVFYAPIMGIGGIIRAVNKGSDMWWTIAVAVIVLLSVISSLVIVAMPKFRIMQKLIDRLNLVARENLSGMLVIRAFNRQAFEEQRFDDANNDL